MFLLLPPDVWEAVADLLQSESLSQVCQTLWKALGAGRYVRLHCTADRTVRQVARVAETVRALELHVTGPWYPADTLAALTDARHLQTLALHDAWADVCALGAHGFTALTGLRALTGLTLGFANAVGVTGAQALAALKDIPALRTLTLHLAFNELGDAGVQALVGLRDAPALHSVTLNLVGNGVGPAGAAGLAALKDTPSLHTLVLTLGWNVLGDRGVQALAALKHSPSLRSLSLHLGWNAIGDCGAGALAELRDAPSLETLILHLMGNAIGDVGAQVRPLWFACAPSHSNFNSNCNEGQPHSISQMSRLVLSIYSPCTFRTG